ncbi:MAG: hypothetical protein ABIH99_05790 [Candidatus Micrarchaeota archaeon]
MVSKLMDEAVIFSGNFALRTCHLDKEEITEITQALKVKQNGMTNDQIVNRFEFVNLINSIQKFLLKCISSMPFIPLAVSIYSTLSLRYLILSCLPSVAALIILAMEDMTSISFKPFVFFTWLEKKLKTSNEEEI